MWRAVPRKAAESEPMHRKMVAIEFDSFLPQIVAECLINNNHIAYYFFEYIAACYRSNAPIAAVRAANSARPSRSPRIVASSPQEVIACASCSFVSCEPNAVIRLLTSVLRRRVEKIEGYLPWDGDERCFALRVRGDSMIGAGILSGDKVVVRPQPTAENGQIVVALLDDSATVKRFCREKGKVWLLPENPAYDPIDGTDCSIIGLVKAVYREY